MKNYFHMFELLKKYNFQFESSLSSDITCVVCHDLLKDACQGPCGCLYCRQCIDKYLEGERKCCPGNSPYCSLDEIAYGININRDNSANRKIEKLKVKCPINSCEFRTDLIEMSNHLKICGKIELSCPYRDMGCNSLVIDDAELMNHLQINSYQHSKLMVAWMMNTRVEMLSQNRMENLEMRISRLWIDSTHENERKQTVIDQLQNQLKTLKNENKDLSKLISQLQGENFKMKYAFSQNSEATQQSFQFLKGELEMLKLKISGGFQFSKQIEVKVEKSLDLSTNNSGGGQFLIESVADNNEIASLEWEISDLQQMKIHREYVRSEWFFSNNLNYKMVLCLNPDIIKDQPIMQIRFNVWENNESTSTIWPFNGFVHLSVHNKGRPNICQTIDRNIKAENPITVITVDPICQFDFLYSNLQQIGIDISQPIIIKCVVENSHSSMQVN